MKRERKQLLLKDLCARLPYGVKIKMGNGVRTIRAIDLVKGGTVQFVEPDFFYPFGITIERPAIQPYLRPMSSMTEDEKIERLHLIEEVKEHFWIDKLLDFYLSHHLDFRGLISMGIALEAPKGMYKIE